MAKGGLKLIWFLVHAILGVYLLNVALEFVTLPDFVLGINKYIVLVSGVLLIISGVIFLLKKGLSSE